MESLWYGQECSKRVLSFQNDFDSDLQDTGMWVNDIFLLAFLHWLVMSVLFCVSEVRVLSSSGCLHFVPSENCRGPAMLSNVLMPPPGQSYTRRTSEMEGS